MSRIRLTGGKFDRWAFDSAALGFSHQAPEWLRVPASSQTASGAVSTAGSAPQQDYAFEPYVRDACGDPDGTLVYHAHLEERDGRWDPPLLQLRRPEPPA